MSARAGQLVRLMSSPNDNEALAALRALGRLMEGEGFDFHWLAESVERAWTKPIPIPWYKLVEKPWQTKAKNLLHLAAGKLSRSEIDFLRSMADWRGTPSGRQL